MPRKVICRKYKEELEGMEKPPYPGPKGEDLFNSVSQKAWDEWLEHQKMLINEGQLNLADRESRNWLNEQMELFLSGEDYSIADIGTFPWIARHEWHDIGLAKYKNLTRWYNEISKREAVQRGFAFMNKEEFPPKP